MRPADTDNVCVIDGAGNVVPVRETLPPQGGDEDLCARMHAWVLRDPSNRSVSRMASVGKKCVVTLRSASGNHTSETQETFASAIRTVLMIANFEGEK